MSAYYVEISEHDTRRDFVPFRGSRMIPGGMYSARMYGPYTEQGAERVASRAIRQVTGNGPDGTYPASRSRYAHWAPDHHGNTGTRMVRVHTTTNEFHAPFGWQGHTTRNMPRDTESE